MQIRLKKEKEDKALAKAEAKLKIKRDFAENYWKTKEVEYRADAAEVHRIKDEETSRRQRQVLELDEEELRKRDYARKEEQTVGPSVSSKMLLPTGKDLGIFAVPSEKGEFAYADNGYADNDEGNSSGKNNNMPGVDDFEVDLFQRTQQAAYEEKRIAFMDSEAQVGAKEDLYQTLKGEAMSLTDEAANVAQLKSRLATELQQNQAEMDRLLLVQQGPPRRDPTPEQRTAMHMRKDRARSLAGELTKLSRKEQALSAKVKRVESHNLKVSE